MILYALPALYALFIWWFSTGVIMYLDGLPRATFKWSILGATLLMVLSLWGVYASRDDASVAGAYCAFSCGLLAWGWQEISFYMGYVTGPRKQPCPEGCSGWKHFGHAIQTSLWHELAIIAMGVVMVALTWGTKNQIGMWTFMVLWWMHQSAKLNVFLGVRNLNEEFLPEHLQFLKSFLTKKPMNLLFPLSITVSTVILVKLVQAAVHANGSRFDAAGFCFLAVLMGLAILEHWLLMLPLPAAALWGWSLKSRQPTKPFDAEVVAGFLGAGKTTFMRARLQTAGPRTVVLVNDFASVGVDGSLLRERGADVVELPNGCICCSLRKDLAEQLKSVVAQWSPERVLIEPSGVADLASLLSVMRAPDLAPLVRSMAVTTVIDGGAFLRDYGRLPAQLDAQARLSSLLVLNKVDLVGPAELMMVETTLRGLNPTAPIMRASFGIAAAGPIVPLALAMTEPEPEPEPEPAPAPKDHAAHDHAQHARDDHGHGHDHAQYEHDDHDHDHHHDHHAHGDALSFDSWSGLIQAPVESEYLLMLLSRLADGAAGDIERLKGIARMGDGWVRFDIAGGRPSIAAFAPKGEETPRVIAIGRHLKNSFLADQFGARGTMDDVNLPLPAVA
jgi:putative photosynthetic complex assembly protein 2